ncbi:MAG TPA: aminopeptidase [Anaerolineales bacterium]
MIPDQQSQLDKYIDLILRVGLNLRRGQRLLVECSLLAGVDIALAPFVRQLARAAYDQGASFVDVIWGDPELDLIRLQKAPAETLGDYPNWPGAARLEHVEACDAFLSVRADDPDLLAGIDSKRIAAHLNGIRRRAQPAAAHLFRNATNWCVAAVPLPPWAAKVFPDLPSGEQVSRLWQLIFSVCRIDQPDPVASWQSHAAELGARAAYLTGKQYNSLRYSGPDIDLRVGLAPGHIWNGGAVVGGDGRRFIPNLPTEEVFTLPDRLGVDGHVTSTRPFEYGGTSIEGMSLRFEKGEVTGFSARTGEGVLRELIHTDEGSSRLGEVSLVPDSSLVARAGVTFHSILFDENASCHLAFGNGYRSSLEEADDLTDEEFAVRGGNTSKLHTDFMIGSSAIDVDGLLPGGQAEPVMRAGEWAFEV